MGRVNIIMKIPTFKDSGQFKAIECIPETPATFEPGICDTKDFRKVLAFNSERDKHIPLPDYEIIKTFVQK
jgi:hypothetical protein